MAAAAVKYVVGLHVFMDETAASELFQRRTQVNGQIHGLKLGQWCRFFVLWKAGVKVGQQIDIIANASILLIHLITPEFQQICGIFDSVEQQKLVLEILDLASIVPLSCSLVLHCTGVDQRLGLGVAGGNGDVLQRQLFPINAPGNHIDIAGWPLGELAVHRHITEKRRNFSWIDQCNTSHRGN